jgi:hypothetical protein
MPKSPLEESQQEMKRGNWARKIVDRLERDQSPEDRLDVADQRLSSAIRKFGTDGGASANARADVAKRLEELGRYAEARLLRQEVLGANQVRLGSEHPHTLIAQSWLILNLRESGMNAEARPLAMHLYETRKVALGPYHEDTKWAADLLAAIDRDGQSL